MSSVRKAHAEHRITGLQQCLKHGDVRAGTGVRLNIGKVGTEQGLSALDGQRLRLINKLAAAVISLTRIPFCVLIG